MLEQMASCRIWKKKQPILERKVREREQYTIAMVVHTCLVVRVWLYVFGCMCLVGCMFDLWLLSWLYCMLNDTVNLLDKYNRNGCWFITGKRNSGKNGFKSQRQTKNCVVTI